MAVDRTQDTARASAGLRLRVRRGIALLTSSRANARAGLVADAAVGVLLLIAGMRAVQDLRTAMAALAAGVLLFSFVEYSFHRWLFHGRVGLAEAGHREHHDDPTGDHALPFFLPPLAMCALAAALHLIAPHAVALLLAGALASGYAAYGIAHTAIHQLRFRHRLLVRWAALHHIHHHHPRRNFGVTSPLWDFVLGTRYVRATRQAQQ